MQQSLFVADRLDPLAILGHVRQALDRSLALPVSIAALVIATVALLAALL
jgi:hypothetical protein